MMRIAFIGGGGFAKEVQEIAEMIGHAVVGYVGTSVGVLDCAYWGDQDRLIARRDEFDAVCIAFGAVDRKSAVSRSAVLDWVVINGFSSLPLVSPNATRSKGVTVADGAIVAHGVVMSVDSRVGPFAILNTNAILGHDAVLERNVTLAPGAFVGGNAVVGENSLIAPGAMVLEGRQVGQNVIVGLGATVLRNVKNGATVLPLRSKVHD
jgi:acetyltransferase EpsM